METITTPPSHRSERTKSASRLSKLRYYSEETGTSPIKTLAIPSSPKMSPAYTAPLRELLLLSPSQITRSKTRRVDRSVDFTDEGKKSKTKNSVCGSASPRNVRRSRRRMEYEEGGEEVFLVVKPKKKRLNKSKKDRSIVAVSNQSPRIVGCDLDRIGELINDLVMWRDVSKSSLWFGFGSLCFLSSCFTKGVNFSMFSFISQIGLLFLILSFFSNSLRQRDGNETKNEFKLTEDDILKVGNLILPAANLAISKIRQVFSGEPAMTLKVVPFLLLGAEYGHLITLWRLLALGFFISFTCPKLYSAYSAQLFNKAVEHVNCWVSRAWVACTHKKIVTASIVSAFWNLTSIRTRIFTAFLCLVVVRYRRQHLQANVEDNDVVVKKHDDQQQQTKELVTAELGSPNK